MVALLDVPVDVVVLVLTIAKTHVKVPAQEDVKVDVVVLVPTAAKTHVRVTAPPVRVVGNK